MAARATSILEQEFKKGVVVERREVVRPQETPEGRKLRRDADAAGDVWSEMLAAAERGPRRDPFVGRPRFDTGLLMEDPVPVPDLPSEPSMLRLEYGEAEKFNVASMLCLGGQLDVSPVGAPPVVLWRRAW
jgi:hypothetical protein